MLLIPTPLAGVHVIDLLKLDDERGFFSVQFSREEFLAMGLNPHIEQINVSYNAARGTLRGMHYQQAPFAEAKVVRCIRGGFCDVVVDLRRDSPTFRQWFSVDLTAENRRAVYIPEGIAHGFQTLTDHTEVLYTVSAPYTPSHYRGVRWNDPAFDIRWPAESRRTIHPRDREYPDFT